MSKDLHLFAIGNALMDIQVRVSDEDLASLEIPKAQMRLVEPHHQHSLLEKFAETDRNYCSGGSAANTVVAFSQFGGKAGYGTVLGDDSIAELYAKDFNSLGVELFARRVPSEATGTCLVLVTPDSERTLNTSLAINTSFSDDHVEEEAVKRAEWLYIEGYKFSETTGSEAIRASMEYAHAHNTKIAVTLSDVFIVENFYSGLSEVVHKADLLFCNELEAMAYTRTSNPHDAFVELRSKFPGVALTMGDKGSLVSLDGRQFQVSPHRVDAVDTTGAGDMYAAGFMYGITHGYTPDVAGSFGSAAAARVVSQMGARLHNDHIQDIHSTIGSK